MISPSWNPMRHLTDNNRWYIQIA